MEFWSCDESLLPEEVAAGLTNGPLTAKPRFLIYASGEKKTEISGAELPLLEAAIQRYLPTSDD